MKKKLSAMKRMFLIVTFCAVAILGVSQELPITFTAQCSNGDYHPFDKVRINNVTRGWNQELVYPDTTVVLSSPSTEGIDLAALGDASSMKVFPNPFAGKAEAELQLSKGGDVYIRIIRLDGSVGAEYRGVLSAGGYMVNVSLTKPQVAFLCVEAEGRRLVSKLVNCANGVADIINVSHHGSAYRSAAKDASLDYEIGDTMRYVALSSVGGGLIESLTVEDVVGSNISTVALTFVDDSDCEAVSNTHEVLWTGGPEINSIDIASTYMDTLLVINSQEQYDLIFGRLLPLSDFNFGEYTIVAACGRTQSGILTHEMSTECDNSVFTVHLDVRLHLGDEIDIWGFVMKTPKITDHEKVSLDLNIHDEE